MTWDNFGTFFPALTHLSLPQLLVPNDTLIELPKASLVKLDLGGSRGPAVPALTLAYILDAQTSSLQHLAFGLVSTQKDRDPLGLILGKCEKLRVLDVQVPPESFSSEEFYAHLWSYMSVSRPETLAYMSGLQNLKVSQPCQSLVLCSFNPPPPSCPTAKSYGLRTLHVQIH